MDLSGDSSFVAYKHFPDLDLCASELLGKIKAESEDRKTLMETNLKARLLSLTEIQGNSIGKNILNRKTVVNTAKEELESKLQATNELKIKTEILESELNNIFGNISQENIEDLVREVLTLENEKKQRIEKLIRHRDAIIKFMDYYKHCLDCHVTFTKPDIYTFYFHKKTENGTLSKKCLELRTDDYKYWQFIDATVSIKEKEELRRMLEENGNIQQILCEVRRMCR